MAEICGLSRGSREPRQDLIVVCGPYSGKGHTILTQLVESLRALDFPAYLCSELLPAKNLRDPENIREVTCECMMIAKAYLLVFLSPLSLGEKARNEDLTGGIAFEAGVLYGNWKEKRDMCVAFLFDGQQHRCRLSNMLQGKWMGKDFEAVMQVPGDITELNDLAVGLCTVLADLICK